MSNVLSENEKIAENKLKQLINAMITEYPLFASALKLFIPTVNYQAVPLATDGIHLFFNPDAILNLILPNEIKELSNLIIHMIYHGIFGDFDTNKHYTDKLSLWATMDLRIFTITNQWQLGILISQNICINMPSIIPTYRKSQSDNKYRTKLIKTWYRHALKDDHRFWALTISDDSISDDSAQTGCASLSSSEISFLWEQIQTEILNASNKDYFFPSLDKIKDMISNSMKSIGFTDGNMEISVKPTTCHIDYRNLLKKIFINEEVAKIDPDSIDHMMYSYGLEYYDNMPFVEALDECEEPTPQSFVIAIDTSGSCIDYSNKFLGEVIKILNDSYNLGKTPKVYILDCDCKIKNEICITNKSELHTLSKKKLKGGGGTSFIPVFDWINKKEEEGERLKALIYLTDGEGTYPENKPNLPVHFILTSESLDSVVTIPEWVEQYHYTE